MYICTTIKSVLVDQVWPATTTKYVRMYSQHGAYVTTTTEQGLWSLAQNEQ